MYSEFAIFSKQQIRGYDSLTVEVYNAFWESLVELLVCSLYYSFDKGELSSSQKDGKIARKERWRSLSDWFNFDFLDLP